MGSAEDHPWVRLAFLDAFLGDREAGKERSLSEYQRLFPGREALVERIYRETLEGSSESAEAPAGGGERRFGPYRILRELGRGGQAVVYLAEDGRFRRPVALKVFRAPWASAKSDQALRMQREAEAVSRLDHPGICVVHETGEADGCPYIAMKFVVGETLDRLLDRAREGSLPDDAPLRLPRPTPGTGRLDSTARRRFRSDASEARGAVASVVAFVEQVARAVHAAHEAGVIHRDLKPSNVMVRPDGSPVVLDFGLARDEESDLPTLTASGEAFGTPAYMAPEQVAGQRADRRSDTWALGVILHEALTLVRPFEAPTQADLARRIRSEPPADPRRRNPSISRDLATVALVALEKDRHRRYQSALDLAEDLRRVRAREPIRARPIPAWLRGLRWAQRHPAAATSLASSFLLLAGGLSAAIWVSVRRADSLREVETALREWETLADVKRLRDLAERRDLLWPAEPEKVADMDAWIREAEEVRSRVARHRDALKDLEAAARPYTAGDARADFETSKALDRRLAGQLRYLDLRLALLDRPGSGASEEGLAAHRREREKVLASLSQRLTWEFGAPADGFRHEALREIERLSATLDPDLEEMRSRRRRAEEIDLRTIEDPRAAWEETVRRIADAGEEGPYRGLALRPRRGLVPLGPDPDSGLFEFALLASGDPPERDPGTGRLRIDDDTAIVLVLLPGGTFAMGSRRPDDGHPLGSPNVDPDARPEEAPVHEVTLDPFFLSKYEVTAGQWRRMCGETPNWAPVGTEYRGTRITWRNPVTRVSWLDADRILPRFGLVLPTEAQWEYACRGGTSTPWYHGSESVGLDRHANLASAGDDPAFGVEGFADGWAWHAPVGSFAANPFGLHDMAGNVREWCLDDWTGDTYSQPVLDREGSRTPVRVSNCVVRGGDFRRTPHYLRSAMRFADWASTRDEMLGVRPARRLDP